MHISAIILNTYQLTNVYWYIAYFSYYIEYVPIDKRILVYCIFQLLYWIRTNWQTYTGKLHISAIILNTYQLTNVYWYIAYSSYYIEYVPIDKRILVYCIFQLLYWIRTNWQTYTGILHISAIILNKYQLTNVYWYIAYFSYYIEYVPINKRILVYCIFQLLYWIRTNWQTYTGILHISAIILNTYQLTNVYWYIAYSSYYIEYVPIDKRILVYCIFQLLYWIRTNWQTYTGILHISAVILNTYQLANVYCYIAYFSYYIEYIPINKRILVYCIFQLL